MIIHIIVVKHRHFGTQENHKLLRRLNLNLSAVMLQTWQHKKI
jgi:hypothetical protein